MAEKKRPGSGIRYTHSTWNQIVDAANEFTGHRQLGEPLGDAPLKWDRNLIKVKNNTGALRRRGDWLAVGEPISTTGISGNDLSLAKPVALIFDGAQATSRDDVLCCLLNWLPDGEIGLAQISGVCWGLIDVNDQAHRYAEAKPTGNALYNADSTPYPGPIRIISNRTSGTGQILCSCEITQQASRLAFDVIQSGSLTLSTSDQDVTINGAVGGLFDLNDNLSISTPAVTIRRSRLYSIAINGRFAVSLAQNRGVDYELRLQRNTGSGYSDLFVVEGGDTIVDAAVPTGHSTLVRRLERTDVHQLNSGDLLKLVAKKTDRNGGMTVALTEASIQLRS